MANYRLSSTSGKSFTKAPRVSLGRGRFGKDGAKTHGTMDPAVRSGGTFGYRRGQDVLATAGGTKF